jgi:hypothetical protein
MPALDAGIFILYTLSAAEISATALPEAQFPTINWQSDVSADEGYDPTAQVTEHGSARVKRYHQRAASFAKARRIYHPTGLNRANPRHVVTSQNAPTPTF